MSGSELITVPQKLLDQQMLLFRIISGTIRGAGKLRKSLRTVAAYQKKLKKLKSCWDKFQDNHILLRKHATDIDKKHEYFETNVQYQTEKKYNQTLKYFNEMITGLMQSEHLRTLVQQSMITTAVGGTAEQQKTPRRDAHPIWDGSLEWNTPIVTESTGVLKLRKVQCRVSVNFKDGRPEIRADSWPKMLKVRFMSKQQNKEIEKNYVKNSTTVRLYLGGHAADDNWKSLQSAAILGSVPFTFVSSTPTDDLKLLILLYSAPDQEFVGYIPNDQFLLLNHLWKYFQHDETMQALMQRRQTGTGSSSSTRNDTQRPAILNDVILTSPGNITIIRTNNGPRITANNLSLAGPREDGTRGQKRSCSDIMEVARKRNSLEIRQVPQSLDCQPAVGDHPQTAVVDVETTKTLMRQIHEETVPSYVTRAPTRNTDVFQEEILLSQTNGMKIAGGGNSGIENDDVFIIEPEQEQNPPAQTVPHNESQSATTTGDSLDDEIVASRRNSVAIDVSEDSEIEEDEILIIEPKEEIHLMGGASSEAQMHEGTRGNECSSDVEAARKLNLLQIEALGQALKTAQQKEADLKQAYETAQQQVMEIQQKFYGAWEQEELYKQDKRKSTVN